MAQRAGGIIQLIVGGELYQARGNFTYNLGRPVREAIVGADTVHGYKETPQVAFIEGEITDRDTLNLAQLVSMQGVTIVLTLANGKTVALQNAWYAAEGTGNTDEGNIGFRFEGVGGETL